MSSELASIVIEARTRYEATKAALEEEVNRVPFDSWSPLAKASSFLCFAADAYIAALEADRARLRKTIAELTGEEDGE